MLLDLSLNLFLSWRNAPYFGSGKAAGSAALPDFALLFL
jgi:hypothetical protein